MSKGNSGILSKFQTKLDYTSLGIIGSMNGYEVLTEVVIRVKTQNASPNNIVRLCGRMMNDTVWEEIGIIEGNVSKIFHIASWDYVQFECTKYEGIGPTTLISSAYFQDGMFSINAIEQMSHNIEQALIKLTSEVCDIKKEINLINKQIELITECERDEVE